MSENKLPKVTYVGSPPLFTKGASSIHIMKMCQAMERLGILSELVIPSYAQNGNIFEYYGIESEFRIKKLPSSDSFLRHIVHGTLGAIYTKLYGRKYDLVLTRNIIYTYLSTKLGIPTVYDAHHPLVNRAALHMYDSFKNSKNLLRFSANSSGLANIYLDLGLPEEKLVVAPNGVDLERFESAPGKQEARQALGLPEEKKIVCYSGNTYRGRGIELLIDVAVELKDVLFLIVGGLEDDNERYRQLCLVKGVENFTLVGFVPHSEVHIYLISSDILVVPYTSRMTIKGGTVATEFTSPIKLFEYMAASRPIVATSLPTLREILEDGSNALLVKPDSLESLLSGIRKVLDDDGFSESISRRASSDVKKYTWEQRVKRILEGL